MYVISGEGAVLYLTSGVGVLGQMSEGEEAVPLLSGETLVALSSDEGARAVTGVGGVYLGVGVEPVLLGSVERLVSLFSDGGEGSGINSGVQASISGVEALLNKSGKETLPLSSGKGEEDWVSGEYPLFLNSGETDVSLS